MLILCGNDWTVCRVPTMTVPNVCLKLIDSIETGVTVTVVTEELLLIVMDFSYVLRKCITPGKGSVALRVLTFEGTVARVLPHVISYLILV